MDWWIVPRGGSDHDGVTDYHEYIAVTDPTNPLDRLTFQINGVDQELILPMASNVRRYIIEANTNSLSVASSWRPVMDFMGADEAEERIDISEVFSAAKAFFRLRVVKPSRSAGAPMNPSPAAAAQSGGGRGYPLSELFDSNPDEPGGAVGVQSDRVDIAVTDHAVYDHPLSGFHLIRHFQDTFLARHGFQGEV